MNKPKGMSRKDCHNLRSIVRSFLNDPSAIVEISEMGGDGFKYQRHDEGANSTFVEVSLTDKPGTYSVRMEHFGTDCDGRHSSNQEYIVSRSSRRRRYYMSRNWETNRPIGKFGVKSQWMILNQGRGSQRDYTAEAAGY